MQILPITFAAGETKTFELAGRYWEIISSTYPTDWTFYGPNGNITDSVQGAVSGLFLKDPYTKFQVRSATAQTINVLLMETGEGGSRRQPGVVRVVDEITDAIQYQSANMAAAVTAGIVWQQVAAPGANVGGMMVRSFGGSGACGAGGGMNLQVVAAKSAPVGYLLPVQKWQIGGAYSSAAGVQLSVGGQMLNKLLPPGWGLYFGYDIQTAVAAVAPSYAANFELL